MGLEVVVAMRELITFPLFLGILAVSLGQVQFAFLFWCFVWSLRERGWSGEVVVVCNMDCLVHTILEGLCEFVTCALR